MKTRYRKVVKWRFTRFWTKEVFSRNEVFEFCLFAPIIIIVSIYYYIIDFRKFRNIYYLKIKMKTTKQTKEVKK